MSSEIGRDLRAHNPEVGRFKSLPPVNAVHDLVVLLAEESH
jgi:hypothetical protein